MRERRSIAGTFRGEPRETPASDTERSGSASVPDAEGNGRGEGIEIAGGIAERAGTRARDRFGFQCQDFPDADMQRREEQPYRKSSVTEDGERPAFGTAKYAGDNPTERGSGRFAEPGVGGGSSRISSWLDKIGGFLSNDAKTRARKILFELRETVVSEAIQRTIRRFSRVSTQQVLLAILCEHEARLNEVGISSPLAPFSEKQMRGLWRTIEFARASHRREYNKQFAREYSNALRILSQRLPSLMQEAWSNGSWEDDIPRTARGVKDRVNRLRALGNAVVPAQAYPIFRAIAESEIEGGTHEN
jgi:hypothetical protein